MELTKEKIDQLAFLARLEFDVEETVQIREDLARMIAFVEKLQELDTTGVEPLLHMGNQSDVLRADQLKEGLAREAAIHIAPDADNQYFFVPKVIKK